MDENKNNEMSVDELLEKLRASLQTDDVKSSSKPVEDDDIKKAVAEAIGAEDNEQNAEDEEENVSDVPEALAAEEIADDSENEPETEVLEESAEALEEELEVEKPTSAINEEDIFAAWGIERPEELTRPEPKTEKEPEAYVAPAAAKTKIYRILRIESKSAFDTRKQQERQKESVEYDLVDYKLIKQALGMEKLAEKTDEFSVFEPEDSSTLKSIDIPHAEFTYQRQREEFTESYAKSLRTSGIKLLLTAAFAFFLFLIECMPAFGVSRPAFLNVNTYPVVYAMTALQLVWLCGAVSYKEIANGALNIIHLKITSGGMLAILVLTTTVCGAINCAIGSTSVMYHFAVAFLALVVRVFDYLDLRRESLAFEVASSTQSKKYVALTVPSEKVSQIEGLEDYTGDNSLILQTEKCTFVENYFSRSEKRNDRDIVTNKYVVPVMAAIAVIALVITLVKGEALSIALGVFNLTLAVSLPVFALLSSSYPFYSAIKKLYKHESTIVGEKSIDEYSGTTMICFDDADAFPSYGVALENLRIYGNSDIETIIEQMGAVFSKVGGPLKHVFALMTTDCPKPYKVKIEGVYESGIKAVVDGKVLYVGSAEYVSENGFNVVDKSREINGKRFSTVYLAYDGGLRAKFFIRYTLDGGFETIVKKLARRGISSVILTGDSNINDELLAQFLDISKLPIKVIRRNEFENNTPGDRADSGVVSRGGVGDLVGAITMCDRLAGVIGTIRAVRISSAVICALLAIVVSILKMSGAISSLYVLVYHLFWLIPTWLVAKLNL